MTAVFVSACGGSVIRSVGPLAGCPNSAKELYFYVTARALSFVYHIDCTYLEFVLTCAVTALLLLAMMQAVISAAQAQQQENQLLVQEQQLMLQQRTNVAPPTAASSDSSIDDQQSHTSPAAAVTHKAIGFSSTPRSSYAGSNAVNHKPWYLRGAGTFSPRPSASGQARVALGLPDQKRPLSRQIGVLFWRGMLDMLRNPLLTAFHAVGGLVLGVLVGVIFYEVQNGESCLKLSFLFLWADDSSF